MGTASLTKYFTVFVNRAQSTIGISWRPKPASIGGTRSHLSLTPLKGFPCDDWDQPRLLHKLKENFAPWWLREGRVSDEELVRELDAAADVLPTAMERLRAC